MNVPTLFIFPQVAANMAASQIVDRAKHFASGSTVIPEKGDASDEKQSMGDNSQPPAKSLVRCSHCSQLTDGYCGEYECPFADVPAACDEPNPDAEVETGAEITGAREQAISPRPDGDGASRVQFQPTTPANPKT